MKTDSWLYSNSFLKRCFAYFGYYTVVNLIFVGVYIVIIMMAGVWLGMSLRAFDNPTTTTDATLEAEIDAMY